MTATLTRKIKRAKAERKQNRIPITAGTQFKSAGVLMETVRKMPDPEILWFCKAVNKEFAEEWIYSEDFIAQCRVK